MENTDKTKTRSTLVKWKEIQYYVVGIHCNFVICTGYWSCHWSNSIYDLVARVIFNVLDLNRGDAHVSKKQSITVVTDCIRFEICADSRSVTFIT